VAAVAGGFVVSAYGVVAPSLFGPLLFGRFPVPTLAPAGPFVSKNHFAGYVEMTALLALGLAAGLLDRERSSHAGLAWTESPRAWQILTACAAALVMGLSVLASLSRGGVVSLAAGLAAFVVLRRLVRRHGAGPRASRIAGWTVAALLCGRRACFPEAHERSALRDATSEQPVRRACGVTSGDGAEPAVGQGWGVHHRAPHTRPATGAAGGAR
jgi:hypothetical protein